MVEYVLVILAVLGILVFCLEDDDTDINNQDFP